MSTQDEPGIDFSVVPEETQQHFRLLELPKELVSILTAEHATVLQLKSREGAPGQESNSTAVLCTPDKTYDLRQVSTSNTLYIVQPATTSNGTLSPAGLEAIAQLHSTLEVLSTSNLSAVPYIAAALPSYTSTGHYTSSDVITKKQLFSNIPMSDAECERGWTELSCFELEDPPRSIIPSASAKLKAWDAILTAATAMQIDLTQPLDEHNHPVLTRLDQDWPDALSRAVLDTLASASPECHTLCLDEVKCARAVGQTLLRARKDSSQGAMSTREFITEWADLLPEKWRVRAELKILEGSYRLLNGDEDILYNGNEIISGAAADGTGPVEAKSSLGAKRKWHEKFRASKKTA